MVTYIISTAAVAFVVAAILLYRYPDFTKRWIGRIKAARRVAFGIFSVLVAAVLAASGQPLLMLWGGLIFLGLAVAVLDGQFDEKFGVN